tara:strand:+ start:533 stop:1444 length:912 start_codon:yes stop_codon:yes gene_type:complete
MKVFICFTPLHILISKQILKHEKINDYIFIYLCINRNKKNKFYYNEFAKGAIYSNYIQIGLNQFLPIVKLIVLALSFRFKYKSNLTFYIGNIKKIHSRLFMLFSGFCNILTFDDGVGNIILDGYFFDNEKVIVKYFFLIFNKKFVYREIIKNIDLHYTIYNHRNVFENTRKISLHNNEKKVRGNVNEELVVLITSPFSLFNMMSKEKEIIMYQKLVQQYKVDFIIKHPLERKDNIYDKSKIIDSHFIAEEIILNLLDRYNVTVIGTYSSVLLNLHAIEGIKIINFRANIKKPLKSLDLLFETI